MKKFKSTLLCYVFTMGFSLLSINASDETEYQELTLEQKKALSSTGFNNLVTSPAWQKEDLTQGYSNVREAWFINSSDDLKDPTKVTIVSTKDEIGVGNVIFTNSIKTNEEPNKTSIPLDVKDHETFLKVSEPLENDNRTFYGRFGSVHVHPNLFLEGEFGSQHFQAWRHLLIQDDEGDFTNLNLYVPTKLTEYNSGFGSDWKAFATSYVMGPLFQDQGFQTYISFSPAHLTDEHKDDRKQLTEIHNLASALRFANHKDEASQKIVQHVNDYVKSLLGDQQYTHNYGKKGYVGSLPHHNPLFDGLEVKDGLYDQFVPNLSSEAGKDATYMHITFKVNPLPEKEDEKSEADKAKKEEPKHEDEDKEEAEEDKK